MELFPPLPIWEAAHPLVVHAPLTLLLLAWVPMLIGLIDFKRRWVWMVAGLLMLLAGTGLQHVCRHFLQPGNWPWLLHQTIFGVVYLNNKARSVGVFVVYPLLSGAVRRSGNLAFTKQHAPFCRGFAQECLLHFF